MHKIINFNNNFSESINISGRIFNIKLLSAYEFILFLNEYNKLNNYLKAKKLYTKFSDSAVEQACLAYFCLYNNYNNIDKKIFYSPIVVLKNLTPWELKYIYKKYIKLQNRTNFYNFKMRDVFEKLKKICINNLYKKYKKIRNKFIIN
ncbi:MAG: hypothetical protein IJC57_00285 [Clostridia bacterium]|nr:hypothetical protein [Clostridia bacterium]MBQ3092693.1 hypothetical protein [Clostridia bacterium]